MQQKTSSEPSPFPPSHIHQPLDGSSNQQQTIPPTVPFMQYATLPPSAPESLQRITIEIKDPNYVEPLVEFERKRQFQDLVTRYMNQLLYGCQRKVCDTPTCWTARKHQPTKPTGPHAKTTSLAAGRKLTVLSARIIAAHLATRDDPYASLCPGKPIVPVGKSAITTRETTPAVTETNTPVQRRAGNVDEGNLVFDGVAMDKGAKDPKSFAQQLFDTSVLRKLEWRVLPPPAEVFKMWRKGSKAGPRGGLSSDDLETKDRALLELDPDPGPEEELDMQRPHAPKVEMIRTPSTKEIDISLRHGELGEVPIPASPMRKRDVQVTPTTPKSHMKDMLIGSNQTSPNNAKLKKTPISAPQRHTTMGPPPIPHHTRRQHHPPRQQSITQTTPSRNGTVTGTRSLLEGPPKDAIKLPQSLSHLSLETVLHMVCMVDLEDSGDRAYRFAKQTIFYTLGCPDAAVNCFVEQNAPDGAVRLDPRATDSAFRVLFPRFKDDVYKALWRCLGGLYRTVPEEHLPGQQPRKPPLTDAQAVHIMGLSFHALAASLPKTHTNEWGTMRLLRRRGRVTTELDMEDELAERLLSRLVQAIFYWSAGDDDNPAITLFKRYMKKCSQNDIEDRKVLAQAELGEELSKNLRFEIDGRSWSMAYCTLEWTRSMFLKTWDGNGFIKHGSTPAGCLQLMRILYFTDNSCGLSLELFHTPALSTRIDPKETPVEWMNKKLRTIHILDFPFLFPPQSLVSYFRATNLNTMLRAYEEALATDRLIQQLHTVTAFPDRQSRGIFERLRVAVTPFLIVEVRREDLVKDALSQIWRREMRELKRPLKVRFVNQGEEGVDHGGVQQEFFALLMREFLKPEYGMFTEDPVTHMSWFQICPFEPYYKYELLGLLFSIAVYNGVTLPVTFPRMLYRHLLGYEVNTIEHIEDGFPELARGLRELLNWDEGDVGDVFCRTYEFSYEVYGQVFNVDMLKARQLEEQSRTGSGPELKFDQLPLRPDMLACVQSRLEKLKDAPKSETLASDSDSDAENKPPLTAETLAKYHPATRGPPPTRTQEIAMLFQSHGLFNNPDAPLVTNANRHTFVQDYIAWLSTYSVKPQLDAFKRGFLTLLPETPLNLFTPYSLQTLVEGYQEIDAEQLRLHARYDDGYSPNHPLILEFWDLVRSYSSAQRRKLLEFVTASDRIPVGGMGSVVFVIQRNGDDSERVPTSLTCFGRLLLPEYKAGTGKLAKKMEVVLENASGFGTP